MTEQKTRREFLADAGGITAASVLAAPAVATMYTTREDTIKVALVGMPRRAR